MDKHTVIHETEVELERGDKTPASEKRALQAAQNNMQAAFEEAQAICGEITARKRMNSYNWLRKGFTGQWKSLFWKWNPKPEWAERKETK